MATTVCKFSKIFWGSMPPDPPRAIFILNINQIKIKSSLYSPYYAEACNELRGPSPRLSAWATQLRRNVATVASHWRHCADLTGPGIEPQTSRTESERFATELTAGPYFKIILPEKNMLQNMANLGAPFLKKFLNTLQT